ncbi:HdeD family acid-resistance protein [Rhodocista pekingensis]|uniref:HdeD family acid-resistance protein n=1 Tax=Rhodocista pekingensis TaxID=201185 RepID=A0ABW2KU84_9PROT
MTHDPAYPAAMLPDTGRMAVLARNWWAFLLRGLLGLLFGLVAILLPGPALLSLALLLAVFLLADGVLAIVAGVRAAQKGDRWTALALEGVAGIAVGILALSWPGATVLVLIWLVGAWAIFTGVLELVAARAVTGTAGRIWLVLGGVLSVLLGILMIAVPFPAGGAAVVFLVGAYAILFGSVMIAWSFQLRRLDRRLHARGTAPRGAVPHT